MTPTEEQRHADRQLAGEDRRPFHALAVVILTYGLAIIAAEGVVMLVRAVLHP